MQIETERAEMAILISDKIDFKFLKTVMRQRRTFYINKRFNIERRYKNYKHLCTK